MMKTTIAARTTHGSSMNILRYITVKQMQKTAWPPMKMALLDRNKKVNGAKNAPVKPANPTKKVPVVELYGRLLPSASNISDEYMFTMLTPLN